MGKHVLSAGDKIFNKMLNKRMPILPDAYYL